MDHIFVGETHYLQLERCSNIEQDEIITVIEPRRFTVRGGAALCDAVELVREDMCGRGYRVDGRRKGRSVSEVDIADVIHCRAKVKGRSPPLPSAWAASPVPTIRTPKSFREVFEALILIMRGLL